jgi:HemY protein
LNEQTTMRFVVWLLLLFVVAVVAATALGTNDGLASFYWGTWRLDMSLNLFLVLLLGTCVALVVLMQAVRSLTTLPHRARQWRLARRDRSAQLALREALAQYFGGRYARAEKSAQRALTIQADTPDLTQDDEFAVLAHLLYAGSAHRLQDRIRRDNHLERALLLAKRSRAANAAQEGAQLLAAEWALDDRDAPRALGLLAALPAGIARRTHALRLKLQATRLGQQPAEALKTARLLAKHQGFSKVAAVGLLRSLAFEALDTAHDIDQLRQVWAQFDPADRRDAFVAARAASRAADLGHPQDGRLWLRPYWDAIDRCSPEDRPALAQGLVDCVVGIESDWLPALEQAAQSHARDSAVALAVGCAFAQRQLWGKARQKLEQAARDPSLPAASRRRAWVALAQLAEKDADVILAANCYRSAALAIDER